MKSGWKQIKLGEVCCFQNGFAFKSNLFTETGHPILRISNIQDEEIETRRVVYFQLKDYKENLDKYRVVKGDLLIAMSGGTTGKIGFNTTDQLYYLNQRVGKFEPKDCLSKQYLFYFLSTRVEENLRISAGSAQPNLSTEQIKDFDIPLPPIPEQRRIVGILDEAFDGIATAKANAEKNLQNARALFESQLNAVFSQRGEGWQTKTIGEVCEVVNGGTPKTGIAEYWNGEHQWITPAEMGKRSTPYIGETVRSLTDSGLANSSARLLPPFSVILSSRAPIGHLVINTKRMTTNQGCKGLIPSEAIEHKYLYYYLTSIVELLNDMGTGATFKEISGGKLKEVTVPLSPLPEQHRIIAQLDTLSAETKRLESIYQQKLTALEALKKSLLHQAFTGNL